MAEKIKLGLIQRIQLLNILPKTSSVIRLIVIKDIKKKINISQDEIEKFNIKEITQGNQIGYSFKITNTSEDIVEIDFTETEKIHLKDILNQTSKQEKITEDLLELCQYFNIT